ncbi:cupin-like domain-containing protein [Rhizorhabdus phycosphaerae]|uniref:cupin-like domain-containing protein n=1 Tax=Rhizorhabdus phycosphaerae TaxID=2711156 RepID=UPI0019D18890|nr:cupin-like domain-containing protein [Rhizorhabdus phycosphaerae]
MNDDLREDIAAMLLDGMAPDVVARRVSSMGHPLAIAESEVARAIKSPYFRGSRQLRWRLGKWRWIMQNQARLRLTDDEALEVPTVPSDRIHAFYRDHYLANRPAVLRGLADAWPARRLWSFDHLATALAGRQVRVQWNRSASADYERNVDRHATTRPYEEIDRRLRDPAPCNDFYVTANTADHNRSVFGPLFEEVGEMPDLLALGGARAGFIWIGPRGTITPWHHDLTNNLLLTLVGRKRVRLVAPHDTPKMRNDVHCFSRWTTDDLPAGPAEGEKPAVLECEIGPGDALFLPIGWWHHVEGLDPHIGMSFTAFRWDNDFYTSYESYRME